jgi:Ni/Co efflux regulator RcnB
MKRHALLALGTLLMAFAGVAAPAMADDDRRGRHGHGYDHHDDDRYDRGHRGRGHDRDDDRRWHDRDRHRHGYSHWDRSDPRRVVYIGPPAPTYVVRHRPVYRDVYYGPPGPPPWARGRHYRYHGYGPTYVVHDYRPYRLYAPPRGYYWRRSDAGEFLLIAITTGIIADIVLNH